MATWVYGIGVSTGSQPEHELVTALSRMLTLNLETPSVASFALSGFDDEASLLADDGTQDLWIYRDNTLLYRGRIVSVQDEFGVDNHGVTVQSVDYRGMLEERIIDDSSTYLFTAEDVADIVWTLIDESQTLTNGDWGIEQGTNGFSGGVGTTGVDRDRTYEPGDSIAQRIDELAKLASNGFDWDIDPLLKLQIYYPARGTTGAVVRWGEHITSATRWRSLKQQFANVVRVEGDAETSPVTEVSATAADFTNRGRIEANFTFPSIIEQATLDDRATELLGVLTSGKPVWNFDLKPDVWEPEDGLDLGDTTTFQAISGRIDEQSTLRIGSLGFTQIDDGSESVSVRGVEE